MRSGLSFLGDMRVRLPLLLAALGVCVVFLIRGGEPFGGGSGEADAAGNCPVERAPALADLSRAEVEGLRSGLGRVVRLEGRARLYEEGAIPISAPWSHQEPGDAGVLASDHQEGAYEMRWWLPGRYDLVDDAFVFGSSDDAAAFLKDAASTDCRFAASSAPAGSLRGARHLGWINPDGFAQEDLLLRRGRTVYRIGLVTPGSERGVSPRVRRAAFDGLDAVACGLPGAECPRGTAA